MPTVPHYSPFTQSQGLVFVSGQLPLLPSGPRQPSGTFEQQTRLTLENLFSVLTQAGTSREHVLKVNAYIVGIENWAAFNSVYADMFGTTRPARTVVPVTELHFGCLLEVDAIAKLPR